MKRLVGDKWPLVSKVFSESVKCSDEKEAELCAGGENYFKLGS